MKSLSLIVTLLLSGCVSQLTEDEEFSREWRTSINAENWELCKMAYIQSDVATVSQHEHRRGRVHHSHEIKRDLVDNRCKSILRDHWIEY